MTRRLIDFIGAYEVTRTIDDHLTGAQSTFEGRAEISKQSGGAIYRESGTLRVGAQQFAAERSYLWDERNGRIYVCFPDGAGFHDFDPDTGGRATEHLCGADWYRGGYDFSEWSCWLVTWDVSGPRKDYQSRTWYVRR